MKGRGVAVVLALVLAAGATAGVFLYVQNVKKAAISPDSVRIIAPKQDIPAQTQLNPLISAGAFTTIVVPQSAVVPGAVTDLTQLQGRSTSAAIVRGEQITTARLQGSDDAIVGGRLGIRDGHQAVGIELAAPQAGLGFIEPGDRVTIYATFSDVKLIRGDVRRIVNGRADGVEQKLGDFTVTVVPDVRVLRVLDGGSEAVTGGEGTTDEVAMSLELTPEDAQKVIYAREKGSVWLALLPPDEAGVDQPPTNLRDLLLFHVRRSA